jgi:hypothetical protein
MKERTKLNLSYLDVGEESEPYDLFIFAINVEQTREKYISRMKRFLEFIGVDKERKLTIRDMCKIFTNRAKSKDGWMACKCHYPVSAISEKQSSS